MAHYSPLGRLGFVWRARDADGRRRNAVLLSLDLYRYLTGVADQWKRLEQQSVADCLKDAPACVAAAR
jgi:hypothetical protein